MLKTRRMQEVFDIYYAFRDMVGSDEAAANLTLAHEIKGVSDVKEEQPLPSKKKDTKQLELYDK